MPTSPTLASIASSLDLVLGMLEGGGAFAAQILVTSNGTTPIPGALVRLTGGQTGGPLTTDINGLVTFNINPGSIQVSVTADGYLRGAPFTSTVDGSGLWTTGTSTLTLTLTAAPVIAPASIGHVLAQGYAYDDAEPDFQGKVYYRLVVPPIGDGTINTGDTQTAEADSQGFISIDLWANAQYMIWTERGEEASLVTTDVSPVLIPQLIGAQTARP